MGLCVGVDCRALCNDWQVFQKAAHLEQQLSEVQFRTLRLGKVVEKIVISSSIPSNLGEWRFPFLRYYGQAPFTFQNWTLNVIESSNMFQPFVEKTFAITFVNTRQEQAKNATLVAVIEELEADVSSRNCRYFVEVLFTMSI